MDVMVRNMEQKDIGAVQQIARSSWNQTYQGIIPLDIQDRFLKSAYSVETLERRLNNSIIYVAEVRGNIVGFANFSFVNEEGVSELGAIYLDPEYQGRGIGTTLLKHGIKNLKDVKEIYIHVEKNNIIGHNFYKAKGFKKVDEFNEVLFGHVVQTIRMNLRVNE